MDRILGAPKIKFLIPKMSPPPLVLNPKKIFKENLNENININEKYEYEFEIQLENIDKAKENIEDINKYIKSKLLFYNQEEEILLKKKVQKKEILNF